jgi:FkbM family methyltransferase
MLEQLLKDRGVSVELTMLEIGAVPLGKGPAEPFHRLLKVCPGSRVIAFEVDEADCARFNSEAPAGMRFYAQALGRTEETRDFYVAKAPMCSSLFPPNQPYCDLFQNLGELVRTTRTIQVKTVSLDHFVRQAGIERVDFIKIDVQGAELEIFQGGESCLRNVMAIVAEVEFGPIYVGQPLYEEVGLYLRSQGFCLHKFLGMAGRTLKPMVFNNDINRASQHLWSDAVFMRDLLRLDQFDDQALFRLALLLECYGGVDASHVVLTRIDQRRKSDFAPTYLKAILSSRTK